MIDLLMLPFSLYLFWAIFYSRVFFHQVWALFLLYLPILAHAFSHQKTWFWTVVLAIVFFIDLVMCIALSPAQVLLLKGKSAIEGSPMEPPQLDDEALFE